MNCSFCKEKLNEGDTVFPKMFGEETIKIYHQQCYEFLVMNQANTMAIEMYLMVKDNVIPFKEGVTNYKDWFKDDD